MFKKFVLSVVVLAMLIAPAIIQANPDVATISIGAEYVGGVSMLLSRQTINFGQLTFPHSSNWIPDPLGEITATCSYQVAAGRHVAMFLNAAPILPDPGVTFGPEVLFRVVSPGNIPNLGTYPFPAVGTELRLWISLAAVNGTFVSHLTFEILNAKVPSGSYTSSATITFADVI